METENHKMIVRAYVEAFNAGKIDAVCRCFAPDAVIVGVLGSGDLGTARPIWEELINAFQLQLQVESMIAEDDMVAVRFTERGTFSNPFRGIAPTGKSYQVTAMEWFEMSDRGITRRWGARDSAAISKQLGAQIA